MGTSKETHIPLIFLTLLYITFGLLERPPFSIELWYPYDSYWVKQIELTFKDHEVLCACDLNMIINL